MTAEWLEWRRNGIGASDVAGILGLSPWASPWSVWADKVGLSEGPDESEAMEFGKRAEPMLGGYFTDRTGLQIAGEQTWCTHPEYPFMLATVDGFVFESDADYIDRAVCDAIAVVEFKTTSEAPWDEVPAHYACQATHIANVTGFDVVWFGVLHLAFGRPTFRVHEFTPDAEDRAFVDEAVTRFWHDHVLTGTPPPTDGKEATTRALGEAWDDTTDEPVELTEPMRRQLNDLADLKANIKRLEMLRAEMENEIKAALADHELGAVDGWKVSWKSQTRTSIDTKALRAGMPEVAEKFTNESTTRVLRITQPKGD